MSVLYLLEVFCLVHFDCSSTFVAIAISMLIDWLILLSNYLIWSWIFLQIFQLVSCVVFIRLEYASVFFWVPSQSSLPSTFLLVQIWEWLNYISRPGPAIYKFIMPLKTVYTLTSVPMLEVFSIGSFNLPVLSKIL